MDALTINLMGNLSLTEAEIQARSQDIIERGWPTWKRERALRRALAGEGADSAALNAYLADHGAVVEQARTDSALLRAAMAYEAAEVRLALPEYDGADMLPVGDDGELIPAPESVRDVQERAAAQAVIDGAATEVLALIAARRSSVIEDIPGEPS